MTNSSNSSNKQKLSTEQGFIITIAEAAEIKFYFDLIRKELKKAMPNNDEMRFNFRQITVLISNAKKQRTITLLKKQYKIKRQNH